MLILIRAEVDKKHECPVMFVAILQVGEVRKKILLYSSLLFSSPKKIG